jgi:hypothetical protein
VNGPLRSGPHTAPANADESASAHPCADDAERTRRHHMDSIALSAALNGSPACRCHDARAAMRADLAGRPGPRQTCAVHSATGRDAAEQLGRIQALAELRRTAEAETAQAIALNSPKLTDLLRVALEAPTTTDTETPA